MPFRTSSAALFLALAVCLPMTVGHSSAAIAGDREIGPRPIGQLDVDIHKAVQDALHKKGFYSGAIDGRVGPMTRNAVLKFRAARGISRSRANALMLDDALVEALFGLPNAGLHSWDDQWCLLSKLGRLSAADAQNACPDSGTPGG